MSHAAIDTTVAGLGWMVADWRESMGIDWMSLKELSQAIPPAYTEHIGREFARHLSSVAA